MALWTRETRINPSQAQVSVAADGEEAAGRHIPWLEQVLLFLAFAVFLSIGPENATPELGQSNLTNTLGQSAALAITAPMALFHWRQTFPLILRSPLLVA